MFRVGAVNYLNSKPLIEGLAGAHPDLLLTLDLPSKLADRLAAGELDVGLIPVVEFFRAGTYSFIPNIAIASRGPVLSVTLFSKVPWREIRSVALDEGSRTSAALTKILLKRNRQPILGGTGILPVRAANVPHEFGSQQTSHPSTGKMPVPPNPGEMPVSTEIWFQQLPIDASPDSLDTDAVLLIGDRAMSACLPSHAFAYDLGQEWTDWTGLPMVFAVWAVRGGVELGEVEACFHQAKQRGLANAGRIAAREAALLGIDPGYCRRYFTNIIHYDLGSAELAGLKRFYELAVDAGLAPEGVELERDHRHHFAASR